MACLMIRNGSLQGSSFAVSSDNISIGRNCKNFIVIPDASISRFHAQIRTSENRHFLRDLSSTYGSFVNGCRCHPELPIADGDSIRLGRIESVFSTKSTDGSKPRPLQPPRKEISTFKKCGETISYLIPAFKDTIQANLSGQNTLLIARLAESMQSVIDLDERLQVLMDILFDVFLPDRGALLLRRGEDLSLEIKLHRPDRKDFPISNTILEHALNQQSALFIVDTATDDRFRKAESVLAMNIRSAICAPMISHNKVFGAIYLDSHSRSFTFQKEDLSLLNLLAVNAAISIENAVLISEKLDAERLAAIGLAITGISHYAKNILTGMTGASNLIDLALKKGDMPMLARVWPLLQQSTDTLGTLVQDMLTFSKQRTPDFQDANLNEVVREIYNQQLSYALEKGVRLLLEPDTDLPNSRFDKKAIHDTLLNVVMNAVEACQGRKEALVRIHTGYRQEEELICIDIIDNGPGIAEEIHKKIFEPFFSTKGSKGTGLGLAVSRQIVLEHGGFIALESEPEKGARFCICLPRKSSFPENGERCENL